MAILNALPDDAGGYQLDNNYTFWHILVPEATRNLVKNPSFEFDTAGYNITAWASSGRSNEQASQGAYSLKLTPNGTLYGLVENDPYADAVGTWTWSFDLYLFQGQKFVAEIQKADSTLLGRLSIQAARTGWKRYSLTAYVPTAYYVALILKGDVTNSHVAYTDGWQFENKPYATSYCDGNLREDVLHGDPYAYNWEGVTHQSVSSRKAIAGSGGRWVNLYDDLEFKTTGVVGLGLADPTIKYLTLADGRQLVNDVEATFPEFSIVGKLYANSLANLNTKRKRLIDLLNYVRRVAGLTYIRYQPVDTAGRPFGGSLLIRCNFAGGLSGNFTSLFQDTLELKFKALSAGWVSEFPQVENLGWTDGTAHHSYFMEYNPFAGDWNSFSNAGTTNDRVNAALYYTNGALAVAGDFTSFIGVSARRVAYRDVDTGAWSELGAGLDAVVNDLALGTQGSHANKLIAVGNFLNRGNLTSVVRRVAYWSNTDWVEIVGSNGPLNGEIYCVAVHPNGDIYVGGEFDADNASNDRFNFARYSAVTNSWESLNFTCNGAIRAMVWGSDGNLYIGGEFTALVWFNPSTSTYDTVSPRVAKVLVPHNAGGTIKYVDLGLGLGGAVKCLRFGPDGFLYAGGDFTVDGGSNQVRYLARYNGQWEEVGNGEAFIRTFDFDKTGLLIAARSAYAEPPPSGVANILAAWTGSEWVPMDVVAQANAYTIAQIKRHLNGRMTMAMGTSSQAYTLLAKAAKTVVTYRGTTETKPIFHIVGQGHVRLIANRTTGSALYFKNLYLAPDEHVTIDLTGTTPYIGSNLRANLLDTLLYAASNVNDFKVVPGENVFVAHISWNTTANTKLTAILPITQASIDAAVSL